MTDSDNRSELIKNYPKTAMFLMSLLFTSTVAVCAGIVHIIGGEGYEVLLGGLSFWSIGILSAIYLKERVKRKSKSGDVDDRF